MFSRPKTWITSLIKFEAGLPVAIDLGVASLREISLKLLDNRILKAKSIRDLRYYVYYQNCNI